MRKTILVILAGLLAALPAKADKVATAKYHTKEAAAAVYDAAVQATVDSKFTLRSADKAQRTINAYRTTWGDGAEAASVFITVESDGEGSYVKAIFTRHSGIIGGGSPTKLAAEFGNELVRSIPDLTFEVQKR
jgi:hypothetical protein